MTRPRSDWRIVFETYPCPTCGAAPGQECLTTGGRVYKDVHVSRTRDAQRCPRCKIRIRWDDEPGTLCPKCQLLRTLEIERYSTHVRRDDR